MINILPYNEKRLVQRMRMMRIISTAFFGLGILVIISGILLMPTILSINVRYKLAQGQAHDLERSGVLVSAVDVSSLEKRTQNIVAKLASEQGSSAVGIIKKIRDITPSGIDITSFKVNNVNNPTAQVQGVASTRSRLQSFISSLENSPEISSIDSPLSNFVKSANSEFSISMIFKKD